MKHILTVAAAALLCAALHSQNVPQAFKGFPSRDGSVDIKAGFAAPPRGYGNVPFYWWTGDSLNIDRLRYELDLMADASTDGFSVSYNHKHPKVEVEEHKDGYGGAGLPDYGQPRAFGDEWWKIWNEFSGLCADKGIGLGMDDYVFMWPGNHDVMDAVLGDPSLAGYQGRLKLAAVAKDSPLPEHTLWSGADGDSVSVVYTVAAPFLHPEVGDVMVRRWFQPFADHCDAHGREGLNYFFQDELFYDLSLQSWCEDMPQEFLKRKGYDIVPLLPLLFKDPDKEKEDSDIIVRTRLDYAEVVTQLAEERYFKKVYDWNASKGLIYGCDNNGRGLDPRMYMDYFRAISWFTAPGNDAPARGSSFRQTKVSSSVAHLYQRPRTWLEAFHSMGWDANGALLTHQLDHHLIAGGNLLCMHGMYYTTHGGWWEWAPPSFHFRMPYWPHMKKWLEYAERMCFVLSQGVHVCDIALLYNTETLQAYPEAGPDGMFDTSLVLSESGLDYDFIDYQSLQKAEKADGRMSVAGESYKVLVLSGVRAMHEETAAAVEEFKKAGGIVVSVDGLCPQIDPDGVEVLKNEDLAAYIRSRITPDFQSGKGEGRVLHRKVGERDVYMVMDVQKGDEMFFRSTGKAELWDAMHGTVSDLPVLNADEKGTTVRFDGEQRTSKLIVFSPGVPVYADKKAAAPATVREIPVSGDWDVEIIPTLDNSWGDFRLPASDEKIGVEARSMRYAFLPGPAPKNFQTVEMLMAGAGGESVYGYAPYMLTSNRKGGVWRPYEWSWQYGVFDNPGNEGYHGLKGNVDPGFLILDKGGDQLFKTKVYAPAKGTYRIVKTGVEPDLVEVDGDLADGGTLTLDKGWHSLYVRYASTRKTDHRWNYDSRDERDRSMVVIMPEGAHESEAKGLYDDIVCSKWYESPHLTFDPYGGEKGVWAYQFETAPGARSIMFEAAGPVSKIWADGKTVAFSQNGNSVSAPLPENSGISTITMIVNPVAGFPGNAFFLSPVKIHCEGGRMPAGDWSEQGAMRWFSGGVRYTRTVEVDDCSGEWLLELGDVDATCEVSINGSAPQFIINVPYSLDVTKLLKKGENTVSVLVYSSLSNHCASNPSPYKGKPHAGLLGPVKLRNTVTTGKVLRLATYNVGAFHKEKESSVDLTADLMSALGVDVLSFNEVDSSNRRCGAGIDQRRLLAEAMGERDADGLGTWGGRFFNAMNFGGGGYGSGIVASPSLKIVATHRIALAQGAGTEPRVCGVVEFEDFVFATTHLDYFSDEVSEAQARTITAFMKEHYGSSRKPVFVCGDFNEPPESNTIKGFCKDWTRLSVNTKTCDAVNPRICIDYIFQLHNAAPAVKLLDAGYCTGVTPAENAVFDKRYNVASDHLPVWVDVDLKD